MFPGPENKWCLQHEVSIEFMDLLTETLWIHIPLGREMFAVGRKLHRFWFELFCKFQTYIEVVESRLMARFSLHPRSNEGHKEQLQIHKFSCCSSDEPGIIAANIILLARFLFS